MNYKDAFHRTVHEAPGGCEALAVRLGYTAGLLRNKANPNSTTNVLTMDDASRVMEITQNYDVLHALARQHGFVCTKLDEAPACDMAVLESVTGLWATLGAFGGEIHQALADGHVDAKEVAAVDKAMFAVLQKAMQLRSRFKGMAE